MIAVLDTERLEDVIDSIAARICLANRTGDLESLLDLITSDAISSDDFYDTHKDGKIVVLGIYQVKERGLPGIVKSLGPDKERFEFCLDYKEIVSCPFS